MAEHDSETIENVSPALAAAKYFVERTEELAYEFGAASHAGLKRPDNQDHYIVLRRTRTQQLLLTNVPTEELTLPTDEAYRHGGRRRHGRHRLRRAGQPAGDPRSLGTRRPGHQLGHETARPQLPASSPSGSKASST